MKKLGILTCLLSFATVGIHAQETAGIQNMVDIRTLVFRQEGDSVILTYQITPTEKIKKWEEIGISCHIQNGDSTQLIDSLQLTGKYRYIHAQRDHAPETMLYLYKKKTPFPEINLSFAYKEWMRAGRLQYRFYKPDCCTSEVTAAGQEISQPMQMQAIPVPAPYAMKLHYTFVTPEAKAVKDMNSSGSAFLEFPAGKSQLLIDFKNNRHELSKIHLAIDSISQNKYARIIGVDLMGYASIDGGSNSNHKLSLSRAESARGFIRSTYPKIHPSAIRAQAGGEDWAGLRALVREMPLFEKINSVLDMPGTEDAKEKRIRTIEGGRVYRTLSDEIFPRLRRVDYTVRFTVKAFTVEEGKELLQTAPGNLSLNELFLIANTYAAGSPEFQDVFDIAVRLYPQDTVARINASSIALERNDLQRAAVYLRGLEDDHRALNNRALLSLAEGKAIEAQALLEKACSSGNSLSCQNKDELLRYLDREKQRAEIIRKKEGSYEK